MSTKNELRWFCPLLGGSIPSGECIDINYERLDYMKESVLHMVRSKTGKSNDEISSICEKCPNLPL